MAAAKLMAKLQTEQDSVIQMADLHSKHGSTLTEYTRKKDSSSRNRVLATLSANNNIKTGSQVMNIKMITVTYSLYLVSLCIVVAQV
jgi:hypothetical protein